MKIVGKFDEEHSPKGTMKPSMSQHVAWERLPAFQGMATPQVRVKPRRQSLTLAENLLAVLVPQELKV